MAAKPKSDEPVPQSYVDLHERMRALEEAVYALTNLLVEPIPPERIRNAGMRKRVIMTGTQAAFRARIGRAAKRHDMTVEEWIERYGEVDRLPDAARDQQDLPLGDPPPSRSPGKAAKGKRTARRKRSRAGSK